MLVRAPRRRISPQARRRCNAIKGFFKRALGSLSQPDLLQITSSIAVNVTDINHRIGGLEQHLSEVCKQYSERDLQHAGHGRHAGWRGAPPGAKLDRKLTDVIYTKSQNKLRKSTGSDCTFTVNDDRVVMNSDYDIDRGLKLKKKKSKSGNRENDRDVGFNHHRQKTDSSFKTFVSSYSTSSFRSLDNFRDVYFPTAGYSGLGENRNRTKSNNDHYTHNTHRESFSERYEHPCEEKPEKNTEKKKSRHNSAELDADFIADIIKRQYKPVKFGRRHSDLSQFSTPVCRDFEFCRYTDYIPEERETSRRGAKQPASPRGARQSTRLRECCDARSVCDTRLYNAKRNVRTKHHKRQPDAPRDSEIYDLVPVKEKSSPKSRRKFIENSMRSVIHKEVPPSPRSHRPQLNLKARYTGSDCNMDINRNKGKRVSKHAMRCKETEESYRQVPKRYKNHKNAMQYEENEESEDIENHYENRRVQKHNDANNEQADSQPETSIVSGIHPTLAAEHTTVAVDTTLNKTQETMASDKTDKALCEIKDILQSFLIEIKKEASSHTEKTNAKMSESGNSPPPHDAGVMTNLGHSFNSGHCPVSPPPFLPTTLPAFGNPCCYPMMPMCPINCSACLQNSNCMQNRYPMPSASYTCNNCYDRSNDTCNARNINKCDAANEPLTCETDELIKQIYNFVSQSPIFPRKVTGATGDKSPTKSSRADVKLLMSRSAGGSTRLRRHDAKVGTTKMNCASKSCEALGARTATDSDTSGSYSDTVLDKFSLEPSTSHTRTTTETELNAEPSHYNKMRQSKFSKVLNSLGLRKKIKRDVIEELTESENTTMTTEAKKRPPFQQHVTNCMMYGQEYYRPPPVAPHYAAEWACPAPYAPEPYRTPRHPPPPGLASPHSAYERPSAPPFCTTHSYDGYNTPMQPQVPLCLKEVEVKSIGCQSERKLSFFQKIKQKAHTPTESSVDEVHKHGSTQTTPTKATLPPAPLFNWKMPAPKDRRNLDTFEFNTQKKLALGDTKMRNDMIKKMFYKRNPFSPRNLIVRTLLGKDKSSFGEPPTVYRPRMFF